MNLQSVFDLVQICHLKGIKKAIISPGSRNAALTIAFARHPHIQCLSIPDERSAAFIALGMSLKSKIPTVLVCTSGSAALNYIPAVAEAYFNQVPLLILTADRPPEWINQKDGQTVFQNNVFGSHIKKSLLYPSLDEDKSSAWFANRIVNEAINLSMSDGKGPVHINIPFREPFYPESDHEMQANQDIRIIKQTTPTYQLSKESFGKLAGKKVLIIVGQLDADNELSFALSQLSNDKHIPIIGDIISNQHVVDGIIQHQDLFLKNHSSDDLKPDILITIGQSIISKNLKVYIRNHSPAKHWHIGVTDEVADTFQCLTQTIKTTAIHGLVQLQKTIDKHQTQSGYFNNWKEINDQAASYINDLSEDNFTEIACYKYLMTLLPDQADLHLANSMSVRYANAIGLKKKAEVEVFCNRGTSGIDGSTSTAMGSAMSCDKQTLLITGDMAFLYDRNAFWHNYMPDNFKVIVFNNHGGGIFRMIDGPAKQPELEEFFETKQMRDASHLAKEFDFNYSPCHNKAEFKSAIENIFDAQTGNQIVEVFTDSEINKNAYKELFNKIQK